MIHAVSQIPKIIEALALFDRLRSTRPFLSSKVKRKTSKSIAFGRSETRELFIYHKSLIQLNVDDMFVARSYFKSF